MSNSAPLTSTWPHLNSDVGLEEGEYQQNCLCAIVAYCVAFQRCTIVRAVLSGWFTGSDFDFVGPDSNSPSISVSSDFMVLCKCF